MKSLRLLACVALLGTVLALPTARAQDPDKSEAPAGRPAASMLEKQVKRGSAKEAKALLDAAVAHIKKVGPQRAYQAFNGQARFFDRDLYVFVIGLDGMSHANGGSPEGLVGMNILDLRDAAGKPIIRDMIALAKDKGEGSYEYVWRNPLTNHLETKTSLVRRVGDTMVGVGYYSPRGSQEEARDLLMKAVTAMQHDQGQALAAFNDPAGRFVHFDLYVFAVGLDDARFAAFPPNPALVGTVVRDLRDAEGHPIIQDMIKIAKDQGKGSYSYVWRNPGNNKVEKKTSFVERVDQYLIGVGYYTR